MSNAMRSSKSILAGVAAGALAAGALVIAAPSAMADTTATTIAWDNPSAVLIGEGLTDDTRVNFGLSIVDSAGDETTSLSSTQKIEVLVTAPTAIVDDSIAYGTDDTTLATTGSGTGWTRSASGQTVTTVIPANTAMGLAAGAWGIAPYGNTTPGAAVYDWDGIVGAGNNGTYTLTARLINTTTNTVISTSTASFNLASLAGAPAATPLWISGPGAAAGNVDPIDVLGQTVNLNMDTTDDSPVLVVTDANGGPYVLQGSANGSLDITAGGATSDDSMTGGWNTSYAAGNSGMTGVYTFAAVVPTWSSTGNTTMKASVVPVSTTLGSKTLTVSVAGAQSPGEVDAVLENALSVEVATDVYQVPLGTSSLTFGISTDTNSVDETTLAWNAWGVTDSGSAVTVPSGGVSAQKSDEGTVTVAAAAGFGVDGDDLYFQAGTGAVNDTVQVVFAAPVATIATAPGIAKVATATTIPGSITDQFGRALLGTWAVSLKTANSCTSTSVATATAAADGSFTLDVPAAQAPTSADTKTFYVCATNGFGTPTGPTSSSVVYTTTGGVGSLTVAPANVISGLTTTIRPLVQVPGTGTALLGSPTTSIWNPAVNNEVDDSTTVSGAGQALQLTATTDVSAPVTFTGSEGVLFSSRVLGGLAYTSGVKSYTSLPGTTATVSVIATKPGLQTVTATSGSTTTTYTFYSKVAYNTGRVIAADPATLTMGKNEFKPIKYTVTDIYGNAVPANTFGISFAGGGSLSATSATTNAAGEATIYYTAPTGTGTSLVTATGSTAQWITSTGITGAPAPKRSADTTITITDKPVSTKSIIIVGERGTVSGKPGIVIDGDTTGFDRGATVKPWVRFPGQTSYAVGTARPQISAAGDFSWQRKTGKKTYVFFTNDAEDVKSNRIIIAAN